MVRENSRQGWIQIWPIRLRGIKQMAIPINAVELWKFLHFCRWMASAIPYLQRIATPLHKILESAYQKTGRRTTRSIKNIQLSKLSWGKSHEHSVNNLQDSLREAVRLAYPKDGLTICIHTDASDSYWSAIVTQVRPEQIKLPKDQKYHQPLALIGA